MACNAGSSSWFSMQQSSRARLFLSICIGLASYSLAFLFACFTCTCMASFILHMAYIIEHYMFAMPHMSGLSIERPTLSGVRGCLTPSPCITGVHTLSLPVMTLCVLSIGIGVLRYYLFARTFLFAYDFPRLPFLID